MKPNNEQDSLLEAVFADPENDAPRLAYADWLAKHGEPEYAEFIRAQIEQAVQPSAAREKREGEAWEKLARKWSDLCAPQSLFRKEDFRRGLVFGATEMACQISVERFVELSDRFWPRIPMRNVIMMCKGQVPDAFFDCAHLHRLTGLALLNAQFHTEILPEAFAIRFFSCDPFEQLEWLVVTRVPMSRPVVDALRTTPYFPRLRSLGIDYLGINAGAEMGGELRFPTDYQHPLAGELAKRPGGAVKMIEKAIPELEKQLVVVPPGVVVCREIVEHTRRVRAG